MSKLNNTNLEEEFNEQVRLPKNIEYVIRSHPKKDCFLIELTQATTKNKVEYELYSFHKSINLYYFIHAKRQVLVEFFI